MALQNHCSSSRPTGVGGGACCSAPHTIRRRLSAALQEGLLTADVGASFEDGLRVGWLASTQNLSCSLLKVWRQVLLLMSHTLMDLSSLLERINSCLGWKIAQETLL